MVSLSHLLNIIIIIVIIYVTIINGVDNKSKIVKSFNYGDNKKYPMKPKISDSILLNACDKNYDFCIKKQVEYYLNLLCSTIESKFLNQQLDRCKTQKNQINQDPDCTTVLQNVQNCFTGLQTLDPVNVLSGSLRRIDGRVYFLYNGPPALGFNAMVDYCATIGMSLLEITDTIFGNGNNGISFYLFEELYVNTPIGMTFGGTGIANCITVNIPAGTIQGTMSLAALDTPCTEGQQFSNFMCISSEFCSPFYIAISPIITDEP